MTSIEPAHRAIPVTDGEREQMEAAFRAALDQLPENTGFPHDMRELGRPLFETGWISGVRSGHIGPALADVPLPPHTFGTALANLSAALHADSGPSIGQLVSYHGSKECCHGRYWVTRIERELDRRGRESVLYRLIEYRNGAFVTALTGVHTWSVTALPQHWQR